LPIIPELENEQINSQNGSGGEEELRQEDRTSYYHRLIPETIDLNQFVARNQTNERLFTESSESELNLYDAISE
jgi:hypothetical protein